MNTSTWCSPRSFCTGRNGTSTNNLSSRWHSPSKLLTQLDDRFFFILGPLQYDHLFPTSREHTQKVLLRSPAWFPVASTGRFTFWDCSPSLERCSRILRSGDRQTSVFLCTTNICNFQWEKHPAAGVLPARPLALHEEERQSDLFSCWLPRRSLANGGRLKLSPNCLKVVSKLLYIKKNTSLVYSLADYQDVP